MLGDIGIHDGVRQRGRCRAVRGVRGELQDSGAGRLSCPLALCAVGIIPPLLRLEAAVVEERITLGVSRQKTAWISAKVTLFVESPDRGRRRLARRVRASR